MGRNGEPLQAMGVRHRLVGVGTESGEDLLEQDRMHADPDRINLEDALRVQRAQQRAELLMHKRLEPGVERHRLGGIQGILERSPPAVLSHDVLKALEVPPDDLPFLLWKLAGATLDGGGEIVDRVADVMEELRDQRAG